MSKDKKKEDLAEVSEIETAKNYEYSVKILRWLLQIVGVWPVPSPTYPNLLRLPLIATIWVLFAFFMIPVGLHTFIIVKDFKTRVRNLGPLSFGLMNSLKFASLLCKRKELRECLEWTANDWRMTKKRSENNLMFDSAKTGSTLTIIFMSFVYISSTSYSAIFSFVQEPIVVNNVSRKPFAFPAHFVFFDPYDHFYKIYAIHAINAFFQFTITNAVVSIAIVCVMHVCGQVSVISHVLHNLPAGTLDKVVFRYIIDKHHRALSFAKKLESFLNGMCLIEMMGCCFNICLLGYYTITEFKVNNPAPYTYFMLMVSFTFNIFIFCYIGNQLSEKCDNIRNIVFNIDWYHLTSSDAKSLLMMITSTQRPVILTAGKMSVLSMSTFSTVLKASMSYLNMLRAITS